MARVANRAAIDRIVADWMASRDLAEIVALFDAHAVTCSPVYSIREIMADPHFTVREMVTTVTDAQLGPVKLHNVVPRFSETPAEIRSTGPQLGEHNAEVYGALGLDADTLAALRARGVI